MRRCQYAQCGKPVDSTAPWGLAFCEQHTLDKPRARKPRKKRALPELSPTCGKGHVFTEESTYLYANGRRKCKTCAQEYRDRHKAPRCSQGHAYTAANTAFNKAGQRRCLTCNPDKGGFCRKGHVLTKSNTMVDSRGAQRCLDCKHERELALVVPPMKHKGKYALRCKAGHLYTKRITRFDKRGKRICTECEKAARVQAREAAKYCTHGHYWRSRTVVKQLAQECVACRREHDLREIERRKKDQATRKRLAA